MIVFIMFWVRRKYWLNVPCDDNRESSTHDLSQPVNVFLGDCCNTVTAWPSLSVFTFLCPIKDGPPAFRAQKDMTEMTHTYSWETVINGIADEYMLLYAEIDIQWRLKGEATGMIQLRSMRIPSFDECSCPHELMAPIPSYAGQEIKSVPRDTVLF